MDFTHERFEYTRRYVREVFGAEDEQLAHLMERAVAAGLPDIAVSPDVGHLLQLLVAMSRPPSSSARAQRVVELGTLAGYSTIWLARGLAPGGQVVSVEIEETHARFAEREIAAAGVGDRVVVQRGAALDELRRMQAELGDDSVDLFFFDAVKQQYQAYWDAARTMLRPGGLLVADNVLGAGWWIDEVGEPNREAIDVFNRAVAADAELDVACVPLREGVLVARKREAAGRSR